MQYRKPHSQSLVVYTCTCTRIRNLDMLLINHSEGGTSLNCKMMKPHPTLHPQVATQLATLFLMSTAIPYSTNIILTTSVLPDRAALKRTLSPSCTSYSLQLLSHNYTCNYNVSIVVNFQYILNYCMNGRAMWGNCLLYTSPSPRDATLSRMPSSA